MQVNENIHSDIHIWRFTIMLKAAMLSKWHVHAEGYARELQNSGKVEIKAVWDEDAARGAEWAGRIGADFEADLDTLLAREDIEAVFCCTPTTMHTEVLIKAAKAGKHIFTEKALAPTVAECMQIKEAVDAAGVTFAISYPQRGRGMVKFAKKMLDEGAFGRVTNVRMRDAHSGVSNHWLPAYWFEKKDAAGGAMMDLGCHPMYILAYLLGKPKRICGMFSAPFGTQVDENAVSVIEFENGAIGVAETGFVSYNSPQTLEIYGTEGTLIAHGEGDVKFTSKKLEGMVNGFITPALPKNNPAPIMQFVDACINGTGSPADLGMEDAIALTELLENSYIADEKNEIVKL